MIPGPDQIIACPHCGGLAKHGTILSGNTFGVRIWTDSKRIAQMLPRPPAVVKCHHCSKYYWLADAEEVGTDDLLAEKSQRTNPDWTAAKFIQEPSEKEYYHAIEEGLAKNARQEKNLRILAWWRSNDPFRETDKAQTKNMRHPEARRMNLDVLKSLLDERDENECLLKSEILREPGDFESAKQLLIRINSPDLVGIAEQIKLLCENGDTNVRLLNPRG